MSEYPYPFFDEKGKVTCQLCGQAYLVISPMHLKKKHNGMTHPQYKEKFPEAPLANDEFTKRGVHGKNKDLFFKKDAPAQEEGIYIDPDLVVDEYDDLEPEIEELDVKELYEVVHRDLDPMQKAKAEILDFLRLYFANVKQDYRIKQYRSDGKLDLVSITDFCDPVQKIVFDCPDTFWHNVEAAPDLNRDLKLESYGWKILKFPSASPSKKLMEEILQSL